MGRAMLSKSLIEFSVDGWCCVPSMLFGLRPNCGKGSGGNVDLLQKELCQHCCMQCPGPTASHSQPRRPLETSGHLQSSLTQSLLGSLLLSPGSWCAKGFVFAFQESVLVALWLH